MRRRPAPDRGPAGAAQAIAAAVLALCAAVLLATPAVLRAESPEEAAAAPAGAEDAAARGEAAPSLAELAKPGPLLPKPTDPRALSLRFLEWEYLRRWVERDLAGGEAGDAPRRWARARELRLGDEPAPGWDLARRRRGVCVREQRGIAGPGLAALGDSLGGFTPRALLVEGVLTGHLLEAAGLPGCGDEADPAAALAGSLGEIPSLDLEALKEGIDYAALFFAAEREIERARLAGLERVRAFLERPGLLVSVKYGHRGFAAPDAPAGPLRLDEAHELYPRGLEASWDDARSFAAPDLQVLHTPEQNLLQVVVGGEALAIFREGGDGKALAPVKGDYSIDGAFRVEATGLRIRGDGGRIRYDGEELRLWWPSNFLAANRAGLFFSLLIILVTAYLMIQNRRRRRELARPYVRPRRRA